MNLPIGDRGDELIDPSVPPTEHDEVLQRPWRVYHIAEFRNRGTCEYLVSTWMTRERAEAHAGLGDVVREYRP